MGNVYMFRVHNHVARSPSQLAAVRVSMGHGELDTVKPLDAELYLVWLQRLMSRA